MGSICASGEQREGSGTEATPVTVRPEAISTSIAVEGQETVKPTSSGPLNPSTSTEQLQITFSQEVQDGFENMSGPSNIVIVLGASVSS